MRLLPLLLLPLLSLSLPLLAGCAQQCAQVKGDYSETAATATQLSNTQLATGMPTHFGLALKMDLVESLIKELMIDVVATQLNISSSIPAAAGQNIDLSLSNTKALDLKLVPSDACAQCFGLGMNLGGEMRVKLPVLGTRNVPLDGDLNFVAPIVFQTDEATGAVTAKLDLTQVDTYAKTALNMNITGLPEAITRAIQQPLTQKLTAAIASRLKPLDLFTFQMPSWGIKGMKVFPSQLGINPGSNALFVGFTTNLPGVGPGQGVLLEDVASFGGGENLAVAVQPGLIMQAVSLLMHEGQIPRQYNSQGKADPQGGTFVTLQSVAFAPKPQTGGGGAALAAASSPMSQGMSVGFRGWSLGGAPCFWFDALVQGLVRLENKKLTVDLQQIAVTDASMAPSLVKGIANWRTAEFLQTTKRLVETSLGEPKISIPGAGSLLLAPSSLVQNDRTLALKARVNLDIK